MSTLCHSLHLIFCFGIENTFFYTEFERGDERVVACKFFINSFHCTDELPRPMLCCVNSLSFLVHVEQFIFSILILAEVYGGHAL